MDVVDAPACLNCGRPLSGAFCAGCGQKRTTVDLTLREFIHETTRELSQWDGKIPSTLWTLFRRPGQLTVDFLEGRRARWLAPLRVYLICSVAYFVAGPVVEAITHNNRREMARLVFTNADGTTTLTPEMREQIRAGLPARVFGVERLERAAADNARLSRETQSLLPRAMFLLLPMFALLTHLAWRRRLPHYPAHLYLALHIHAVWFGLLALLEIAAGFLPAAAAAGIGAAAFVYTVWYALAAARRVFRESWPRIILKSSAVAAVYGVFAAATSLLLLAVALFRM
jgi:hypothetical protein